MDLLAEVSSPLGPALAFHRMSASEALSKPFEYKLELVSEDGTLKLNELIAQAMTVTLHLPDGSERYFHGLVSRASLTGRRGRFFTYRAEVRPWLWFLNRTQDCRIFQDKTAVEIIEEVFADHPIAKFEKRLSGTYEPRTYCVQYRESDFNFVSRLMEEEGIYYYFTHEAGGHTLVLSDAAASHDPFPGYEEVPYVAADDQGRDDTEVIGTWHVSEGLQTGAVVLNDYDFERPSVRLIQRRAQSRNHELSDYEVYDYPGRYVKESVGEHYVRTRLEEQQAQYDEAGGSTDARGLSCGYLFKLTGFLLDDLNKEYLVGSTRISLVQATFEGEIGEVIEASRYECDFTALDSQQAFRPQRLAHKPIVQGPQTAVVVGPGGDEIYTDKYGRVKVQFHWDRYGARDENSSCWVRVSNPWAGKNYGFIAIPRIGQEVIVDFLEGDPDQPIITGRVYNAEQMPPWALPEHKTRTGIVTRSSTGGSASNANEFRFEDKKGQEEIYMHAELDYNTSVERDSTWAIQRDHTENIHRDRLAIVKRKDTLIVKEQGRSVTIEAGGDNHNIKGNRTYKLDGSEHNTITQGRTSIVSVQDFTKVDGEEKRIVTGAATHLYQTSFKMGVTGPVKIIASGGDMEVNASSAYKSQASEFLYMSAGNMSFKCNAFNRTCYEANDLFLGPNTGTYLGASSNTEIGGARNTFVGMKNELDISIAMNTAIGVAMNTFLSATINFGAGVTLNATAGPDLGMGPLELEAHSLSLDTAGVKIISGGAGAGSGATGAMGPAAAFFMGFGATLSVGAAIANAIAAVKDVNEFLAAAPGTDGGDIALAAFATIVGQGPQTYKAVNPPNAEAWMYDPPANTTDENGNPVARGANASPVDADQAAADMAEEMGDAPMPASADGVGAADGGDGGGSGGGR